MLDWNWSVLALPALNREVVSARLLRNQEVVPVEVTANALLVSLPLRPSSLVDEIIVLDTRK